MFKKIYPMIMLVKKTTNHKGNAGVIAKEMYMNDLIGFDPDLGEFSASYDDIIQFYDLHHVSKVLTKNGIRYGVDTEEGIINPLDNCVLEGKVLCHW